MDQTTIQVGPELFAPAESSSYSGEYLPESLSIGPDTYTFAQPLNWNVLVSNTGGALLVAGSVTGVGTTECSRCLEAVEVPLNGEVEAYYLLNAEETELTEDEEDEFEVLGEDNTINLIPLLEAAILVDVPLQPLCREDCKGICPDCGVNLNEQSCDCAEARAKADAEFEEAKNPFAKLKELNLSNDS
ncbi:MAG: DUF177 domain-containing protein [Eggerthellaceae bacterium]|nr:DUF177 domain-containing protein [Eggerthellaceae bacterium]